MLFLLVVFSVFIPNVYANTEGYETTEEEIREDNDLDQLDITVDLVNGEVTSSEVSDTTTGDVKEDGYNLDHLERIARQKLHHCKLFEFVDEKDKLIDSIINSKANKLNSASDIVNALKEKEP